MADGYKSLYGSSIRGINTLTVNGIDAMSRAIVISEIIYGNTFDFTANINGTNNQNYSINCNISCQSSFACLNLHLYCFGACYVDCDEENGISCPFITYHEYVSTMSPSSPIETTRTTTTTWITDTDMLTTATTIFNGKSSNGNTQNDTSIIAIIIVTLGVSICIVAAIFWRYKKCTDTNDKVTLEMVPDDGEVQATNV